MTSTSSQESDSIPSVFNSTKESGSKPSPPNLSVSHIEPEYTYCADRVHVQRETNPKRGPKHHVGWKDVVFDDLKHSDPRRMTYCVPGLVEFEQQSEVIDQVTQIVDVQEEIYEVEYEEVRWNETTVSNMGRPLTKTHLSTKEVSQISSSVHSEEERRLRSVSSDTVEPIPHQRMTFAHKDKPKFNDSLEEDNTEADCGSVTDREMFKTVLGGNFPRCDVADSPMRRQTFVTSKQEEFFPHKGDCLPSCDEVQTPLRRQTYLAPNKEMFSPVCDGQLPACTVEESPMRRQTFVKGQRDNMRRLSMLPKASQQSKECQSDSCSSLSNKWLENSSCSNTSTPTDGTTPPLRAVSVDGLQMTPITPSPTRCINKFANMRASCMNLLNEITETNYFSDTPKSDCYSNKRKSYSEPMQDSSDLEMCTAPGSPSSEYETAPSTPPEPVKMEDFDNTLDFPTPKIDEPVSRMKNVNLSDVSQMLEQELATQNAKKLEDSMSTDSLEKTLNTKTVSQNQEENEVCEGLDLEVLSVGMSNDYHDNVVVADEKDSSENQGSFLQNRLSTGTVTKETSILHPDDLVQLDDDYNSFETVVKDTPTFSPSSLPKVSDTHRPRRTSAIGVGDSTASSKLSSDHRRKSEPFSLSTMSYQSKALDELLLYKGVKEDLELGDVQDKSHDLSEEKFTVASVADISFSPSTDPWRCSTLIKAPPPEEIVDQRRLSDKGRQLFVDLESKEEETVAAVVTPSACSFDVSVPQYRYLSTIMEGEEGALTFNVSRDIPLNQGQEKPWNKTHTLPMNNSGDALPVPTQDVLQNKTEDQALNKIQDLAQNKSQDLPVIKTQDLTLNKTWNLALSKTQDLSLNSKQDPGLISEQD